MYVKKVVQQREGTYTLVFNEVPKNLIEKAKRLPEPGECVLVDVVKEIRFEGGGKAVVVRTYLCAEKDEKAPERHRRKKKRSRRK